MDIAASSLATPAKANAAGRPQIQSNSASTLRPQLASNRAAYLQKRNWMWYALQRRNGRTPRLERGGSPIASGDRLRYHGFRGLTAAPVLFRPVLNAYVETMVMRPKGEVKR